MARSIIVRRAARRYGRALVVALAMAPGAGCATLFRRPAEDRMVTVSMQAPLATASARTLAAFREQGYEVKETLRSGTEIETEPFRHGGDIEAVFRAAVTETGSGSRVVLSGTYRRRQFGGIVTTKEREVVRATEGVEGELWARLVNLGVEIRSRR